MMGWFSGPRSVPLLFLLYAHKSFFPRLKTQYLSQPGFIDVVKVIEETWILSGGIWDLLNGCGNRGATLSRVVVKQKPKW
jgi:hypothetical protein